MREGGGGVYAVQCCQVQGGLCSSVLSSAGGGGGGGCLTSTMPTANTDISLLITKKRRVTRRTQFALASLESCKAMVERLKTQDRQDHTQLASLLATTQNILLMIMLETSHSRVVRCTQ